MVNTDNIRSTVVKGVREHCKCPFIRKNQTAKMPDYPYLGYTITTHATENKGTYGVYDDGVARKPVSQIWSITACSNNYEEAVRLANEAHDWFDYTGDIYMSDNDVIVESVGAVGDRSNLLTAEYEYSYGFDVTFSAFDEIEMPDNGTIETVNLGNGAIDKPPTTEELIERLEKRLDGEVV